MKRLLFLAALAAMSCSMGETPDAYGIIGADSWMIASPVEGQIVMAAIHEGEALGKDAVAIQLDTAILVLQRDALLSQIKALKPTLPNEARQLEVIDRKKEGLERERKRMASMVESGSASSKSLENLDDQIALAESEKAAYRSSLSREKAAVLANIEQLQSQVRLLEEKIRRCTILNPEDGIVANQYVKLHEFVSAGMPIYKLSDNKNMYADAWIEARQLAGLSLGDIVRLKVDGPEGLHTLSGKVSFISEEAEFTPTKVMTRDTRTRMVYHIKVELQNDGTLKKGMGAELYLGADR